MAEPVLRARGLRYRYPGGTEEALAGVELDVEPGELIVVCGDSGSGKTTLLRAACGLVPHFHGGAVEGELEAGGLDVRAHGPAELASVAGLVAQEPEAQVVSSTVRAELELPLELRGQPPAERARAVEEVALALAIADLLERTTDTLSGGELQRVALAATLVGRPRLLLLDEPTSQLDPVAGDELIGVLRRINEEWGVSVILSEHRLERCLGAADRVVAMDGGAIAFDGDPSRFLEWALRAAPGLATPAARVFGRAGLEPPATVRRARAILRDRGVDVERPALDGPEAKSSRAAAGAQGARAERGDALLARRAWLALGEGGDRTDALRGLDLRISRGEKVALMGRNGAGKTTLLRAAAGLLEPDSGHIQAPHGIALLPQCSDDVLVRESVAEELPGEAGATALELLGLEWTGCSDPRDLSGGERQRLALAVVIAGRGLGSGDPPGAVLLDEPTRGLDRGRKADLARLAGRLAERGAAVVIATHDVEFAAEFADRVLIMGRGEVVADGPAGPLLSGGWYFSTEVARALSGQAYRYEDGVAVLGAAVAAGPGGRAVAEPGAQA